MPETLDGSTFHGLGIAPKILEILKSKGFESPTPIQLQAIPIAAAGKDVLGVAQTGTGKTLAFGIPLIQIIAQKKVQGLVVLPTRELALQVNESLHLIGKSLGLKTAVIIGGDSMYKQKTALRQNPHVIIATPGRLIDHLEQKLIKFDKMGVLVLDEADRMLDMGFAPQLKIILNKFPAARQTMLFSATMPNEILEIATSYMKLPIRIEIAPTGTTAQKVTQEIIFVDKAQKLTLLKKILTDYKGSTLVFSRTKFGAKKIAKSVRDMGHTATEIHSNRSLAQRLEALKGFKLGKYRVMVATDIAARGIDVSGIEVVVNYDLPENSADYVHRIGRTGRAGQAGHAISMATPDQRRDVKDIERLIRKQLPATKHDGTGLEQFVPKPGGPLDREERPRGGFRRDSRGSDRRGSNKSYGSKRRDDSKSKPSSSSSNPHDLSDIFGRKRKPVKKTFYYGTNNKFSGD